MSRQATRVTVNGKSHVRVVDARLTLADFLRHEIGLTGTHLGCEHGVCGACTVLVDGRSARSCLMFAVQASGCEVTTVEGLTPDDGLSVLQQAFVDNHGLQCGFCTPGMLVTLTELLRDNPEPSEAGRARGADRQSVPLHRLCRHRRRRARRRATPARRIRRLSMGAKHFGARVKRLEDPALLAGRGRFVDDVKLPGLLHGAFVRSPHAHAMLRGIDGAPALAMPGVHAVLTADDLPEPMRSAPMPMLLPNPALTVARTQTALARDEVCYVGQPVALVIADTRYIAEDAAAALAVDYEVRDAVGDCRDAIKDGAPRAHGDLASNVVARFPLAYGDVDAAFAGAAHVFEEVIWQHRGGGMAIETRAVLASHDPASDLLTVWSGTQTPHLGRGMLADLLNRDIESIRMIAPDVGGGFGPKAIFYPEEAVIPAAALKLGRPVKWIEDRREHFLCATQERDQYWDMAIAVDTRRPNSRRARPDAARLRRLRAVGHHLALYRRGDGPRSLRGPGLSAGNHRRSHQQGADHAGARRRPAAGGVRDGAPARPRGARAATRPRRGAPPQFHQTRANAVCGRPVVPRRQAAGLRQRRLSEDPASGAQTCRL